MEGAVRSFEGEELPRLQAREEQHGPSQGQASSHSGLHPFPLPSFSTSKTKRVFHRGGVGSNDEEGELDGDEGRA